MTGVTGYFEPFGISSSRAKAAQFRTYGEAASAVALCIAAPSIAGAEIARAENIELYPVPEVRCIVVQLNRPNLPPCYLARIPMPRGLAYAP